MVQKKKVKNSSSFLTVLKYTGYVLGLIGSGFWAGWYIHGNKLSVEFHEQQMHLYNLHQQIDDGYKNDIRQLESEKRELEKEVYELRKESLKNINHE